MGCLRLPQDQNDQRVKRIAFNAVRQSCTAQSKGPTFLVSPWRTSSVQIHRVATFNRNFVLSDPRILQPHPFANVIFFATREMFGKEFHLQVKRRRICRLHKFNSQR